MKHYDEILQIASDSHGYFTAAAARNVGVKSCELVRWVKIGRIENPSRGVYRVANYPPSPMDSYVLAMFTVGKDAVIYGESVLGMLNLIPTNPSWIYVANPVRVRRKMGDGIKVVIAGVGGWEVHDGVKMQNVADAIRATRGSVRQDRRMRAAEEGLRQGFILDADYRTLMKDMENETAT